MAAIHFRLSSVLVVIARWSIDVDVILLALSLIRCGGCKEKVHMYISTTEKHGG